VYQRDLKKHVKKFHPNVDVQDNEDELGEQTDHEGQVCTDDLIVQEEVQDC
jgi:hypothetical protein